MREVDSCDFCGERATGTFEVVPPGRDPTGEGRRMVLCGGCRDTLGAVLEPLLGANGDPGTGTEPTTVVAEPEREPGNGADSQPEPGGDGEVVPSASDGNEGSDEAGAASATDATIEEALDEGAGSTDAAGGERTENAAGGPQPSRRGTPRGYRKVMRFLENREFPLDREEAETLAAEAYEVDEGTVSAVLDHAIKHGRLREASGKLFQ